MSSRKRRVEKRKLMINNEALVHERSPGENLCTNSDKLFPLSGTSSGCNSRACYSPIKFGEGPHEIIILTKSEQVDVSRRILSQLRALWDDNTNSIISHMANAYLEQRNCENVIHECSKIIRIQPKAWQSYLLRASALFENGCIAEAMADLVQVTRLLPQKKSRRVEKLLLRCTGAVEKHKRAHHLKTLLDEGTQGPYRPFLKGDKRITPGQVLFLVQECIQMICKILDNPDIGAAIWKEDELDRWKKRMRLSTTCTNDSATNPIKTHPQNQERGGEFGYGQAIIVEKLKMIHYFLAKSTFGKDVSLFLGSLTSTYVILLAVYKLYNVVLALEIIHGILVQDASRDVNISAFLSGQPLPIIIEAFEDPHGSSSTIASMLLDLIASYKAQKVLTLLIDQDLVPLLLKKIHLGSAREHAYSVSLLFKLSLDPRLTRHLTRLPSAVLYDLCDGLKRACRAGQLITRLFGVQTIVMMLEYNRWVHFIDDRIPTGSSSTTRKPGRKHNLMVKNEDEANLNLTLCELFIKSGVYHEVASILARESECAPKKAEKSSSIWEEDVELICEEIISNVNNFDEMHECTLRDFNLLSGHAQIIMLNCMRMIDLVGPSQRSFEILNELRTWGLLISLLPSFPHSLAMISINILAAFCQRSRKVAHHIANLWPANSSMILLEFACSARDTGALKPYQASMVVLARLAIATCKSFLASIQKPTILTILIDFLQDERSTTITLTAACTCLTTAMTTCSTCVEFAEIKATLLGSRLLRLWCEYRSESLLKCQVENLMFVLMQKSNLLQRTFLFLMQNHPSSMSFNSGYPSLSESPAARIHAVSSSGDCLRSSLLFQDGEDLQVMQRCAAFSQNRKIFETFCLYLSSIVRPSAKLVDLCSWIGLLSIQVAKHFKDSHCYSINRKRSWMEHTRRLVKQEAVQNLTVVLCNRFDKLPQTLPADLDVALLCFSLDIIINDLGHLFGLILSKLHQQGKLVLIDDKESLISEAKFQASIHGWNVLTHCTMEEHYLILVLQRPCEA